MLRGTLGNKSLGALCVAALAFGPAAEAVQYDSTSTAVQGLTCAGDRGASSCTAGDFAVTVSATTGSNIVSCQNGLPVVLDIVAMVTGAQPARYDVGLFIGENSNNPAVATAGGTCSVNTFPTAADPGSSSTAWNNADGNVCGDYNGGGLTTTNLVHNVKVKCVADLATGNLSIPFALTWSNSTATCTGPGPGAGEVAPGTGSKCTGASAPVGGVTVTYNADPGCSGEVVTYDPASGTGKVVFLIQNNNPNNAVPADPADGTKYDDVVPAPVVVTGATCEVVSGGADCGTGPVVNGNDVSGTIPTFPAGAVVKITINGTVPPGQTGQYSDNVTIIPPENLTAGSDTIGNNQCVSATQFPVKLQSFDVR